MERQCTAGRARPAGARCPASARADRAIACAACRSDQFLAQAGLLSFPSRHIRPRLTGYPNHGAAELSAAFPPAQNSSGRARVWFVLSRLRASVPTPLRCMRVAEKANCVRTPYPRKTHRLAQRTKFDRPRFVRTLKPGVLRALGGETAGQLRMHILQHRTPLI